MRPATDLPGKRDINRCAGEGSISTQFQGQQPAFAAGAVTGSFLFFFALGFGAVLLRPIFANPLAWRVLEAVIAIVMWAIALKLIIGA